MRVLYFSDVHIEIRERETSAPWCGTLPLGYGPDLSPFAGAADLLVLAGDIGRVRSTRNVSPLTYAEQAAGFPRLPRSFWCRETTSIIAAHSTRTGRRC